MGNELVEDYRRTEMLPVKKQKAPGKDELKIRDIIEEMQTTCTNIQIADRASKKLKKTVSYSRIQRIRRDMMEEERVGMKQLTSFDAALEARLEYQRLEKEGWRLYAEMEGIEDVVERVESKRKMISVMRESREAQDRMYKMAGLHKEQMLVGHVNITELEEYKNVQQAFLLYITRVMECPQCGHKGFSPEDFFEFMDTVARDPHWVDQFYSRTAQDNYAMRHYGDEAKALIKDAEFDEQKEETG